MHDFTTAIIELVGDGIRVIWLATETIWLAAETIRYMVSTLKSDL